MVVAGTRQGDRASAAWLPAPASQRRLRCVAASGPQPAAGGGAPAATAHVSPHGPRRRAARKATAAAAAAVAVVAEAPDADGSSL